MRDLGRKIQHMRVVNRYKESYTHNIQRGTPFENMFTHVPSNVHGVITVSSRDEAIRRFEAGARKSPLMKHAIMSLPANAVLGCTCKPKACHGDVIVKLWHEWHGIEYEEPRSRNRLL